VAPGPLETGVLGVLQGLTEFLPVSSSGHLALGQMLFGVRDAGLTLNVTLHAGTLLATVLVLRSRFAAAVKEGTRALVSPSRFVGTSGGRDALFVVIASVPTAVIGLLLRDAVARWTASPMAVALGLGVTSVLLVTSHWAPRGPREVPTAWGAALVGLAQGLAVVPGLSRSGTTICVALWLGVRPQRAFELSMLASVPAVLGAVLVEVPAALSSPVGLAAPLAGAAVAFGVGVGALYVLRDAINRGRFAWFAAWTAPLAVVVAIIGS
jgi:undecaprenyl-diphosphatase